MSSYRLFIYLERTNEVASVDAEGFRELLLAFRLWKYRGATFIRTARLDGDLAGCAGKYSFVREDHEQNTQIQSVAQEKDV